MRQLLHLLILDPALKAALVMPHNAGRLLPMIAAPNTSRVGTFVRRWAQERAIEAQPVGQWLGRASPREGAADWLVPVQALERSQTAASGLQWVALEDLKASDWYLDYQRWAVDRLLAAHDGLSVPGPFGHPTWLRGVNDWIRRVLGDAAHARLEITSHRLSSYEVVLECRTGRGQWFFKGLSQDRATEAALTSAMSQLMPALFARTVALETYADGSVRWLMEACPGAALMERITMDEVMRVVKAYAYTQQRFVHEIWEGRSVPMQHVDLSALAVWSMSMVEGVAGALEDDFVGSIQKACADVGEIAPLSWVAADLDPSNVIVNDRELRFIDLDDVVVGPAPLGVATFVRRLERSAHHTGWTCTWTRHLIDAYERAWMPSLGVCRGWRSIDLVSECLECSLAWQRVETRADRGEVYGVREIVRPAIQRRLLRAAARYSAPVSLT